MWARCVGWRPPGGSEMPFKKISVQMWREREQHPLPLVDEAYSDALFSGPAGSLTCPRVQSLCLCCLSCRAGSLRGAEAL